MGIAGSGVPQREAAAAARVLPATGCCRSLPCRPDEGLEWLLTGEERRFPIREQENGTLLAALLSLVHLEHVAQADDLLRSQITEQASARDVAALLDSFRSDSAAPDDRFA
jgi:hypothetical protein